MIDKDFLAKQVNILREIRVDDFFAHLLSIHEGHYRNGVRSGTYRRKISMVDINAAVKELKEKLDDQREFVCKADKVMADLSRELDKYELCIDCNGSQGTQYDRHWDDCSGCGGHGYRLKQIKTNEY